MDGQLRLLVLKKGLKDENSIYRLKKGWELCFTCDPALQTHNVRLFWNLSIQTGQSDTFDELTWIKNDKLSEGYSYITVATTIDRCGAFQFYYTVDGSSKEENCDGGGGYLIVDPYLTAGKDDKHVEMDSLQLHTVLPKLLGPFSEWKERLLVSYKSGYNMIHFTPLQRLNQESKSSYSISDQLSLNPNFSTKDLTCTYKHISDLVDYMKREWNMLSVTDLVYNHTANDSTWLNDHPESAYNLHNSPHLKPAYLLDCFIYRTSLMVASGKLQDCNIPASLRSEEHMQALRNYLSEGVKSLRLHEFYMVDVPRLVKAFSSALEEVLSSLNLTPRSPRHDTDKAPALSILLDPQYERLQGAVNIKDALQLYTEDIVKVSSSPEMLTEVTEVIKADFSQRLEALNHQARERVQMHLDVAIDNVMKGVRYRFIADDGPKIESVSARKPLVHRYFINRTQGRVSESLKEDNSEVEDEVKCKYIMAHNGWVMGDDPLNNFAEPGSDVYLRRELIAWGDSVKLRYGQKPADSPHLWERMEEYTRQTVEIFHGIRLDNCHSTPIHVAQHMMRLARQIRPNLYVMAELFTSHEHIDNLFVNRLGLNSLIREGLSAWNAHEQGRLVYRYGGKPVGSFVQPNIQLLKPTVAHALFMDITHDNDSVVTKRDVCDSLSLSAFVSMACCATGSNRGHDELVPHHIDVVSEERLYTSWSDDVFDKQAALSNLHTGIVSAKLSLNRLHHYMGQNGFEQVYVHDLSEEVVSITRHNPLTHHSFISVIRCAFTAGQSSHPHCEDLVFEGRLEEVKLYGRVVETGKGQFTKHDRYLRGLNTHRTDILTDVNKVEDVPGVTWRQQSDTRQSISFHDFPPGSVLIISVTPNSGLTSAQSSLLTTVSVIQQYVAQGASTPEGKLLEEMMSKLTLADLNAVMYHCEAEERSITGYSAYSVPHYGPLVYTGLQGVCSLMTRVRTDNDLGHAICQNMREGDWLLDYISGRMQKYTSLQQLGEFIRGQMESLKLLPRYLIPCYFDVLLVALSMLINHTVWEKMNRFVMESSPFVKELALASLQFCGVVESARLARLSPSLEPDYKHPVTGETQLISISAGLPHFSEGLMRNWGRDTFIAIRGLLLVTGRFSEARAVILSFAGSLRHGLIPNLHGEGIHARYNCRDAVWWWLQAVQDYCTMAPNGSAILKDEVLRIYPTDDSEPYSQGQIVQPLMDVIQEAFQRHADGITFRERNAGHGIDEHMSDEGFNVSAGIDWTTGFVYGGNSANCGTWMDKMGSSEKAGNKGKPATPRNGSAVELVGLCASAVKWLADMNKKGLYRFEGVAGKRPGWSCTQLISFDVWFELIKRHFEAHFWVNGTNSSLSTDTHPELVNRRDIYKDSVGASPPWADYQLRPNYPIAMAVAPDLFTTSNAAAALEVAEKNLMGPLGMKTLDPSDWKYNGDYVNSNDSDNHDIAKGFNYHNGPEWLWPLGYLLRAKVVVASHLEADKPGTVKKAVHWIENKLSQHHISMLSTDWRSLPELTNTNGKVCHDSCPAQAWSVSCMLDVLYDIRQLNK